MATVASGAIGLALGNLQAFPPWPSWAWLLALALSCQVLGWLLVLVALRTGPAARTSSTLMLQPAVAVALAYFAFSEQPSLTQLIGAALLLAGVAVTAMPATA